MQLSKTLGVTALEDSSKNNYENYYDVLSNNLHNFLLGQFHITITILQTKCDKQVGLNIGASYKTSK